MRSIVEKKRKYHKASVMAYPSSTTLSEFKRAFACESSYVVNPKTSANFLSQMCREIEQDLTVSDLEKAKNPTCLERGKLSRWKFNLATRLKKIRKHGTRYFC